MRNDDSGLLPVFSDADDTAANDIDEKQAEKQISARQQHRYNIKELMDHIQRIEIFLLRVIEAVLHLVQSAEKSEQQQKQQEHDGEAEGRQKIEYFLEQFHRLSAGELIRRMQ